VLDQVATGATDDIADEQDAHVNGLIANRRSLTAQGR